jgi:hypothetical protein
MESVKPEIRLVYKYWKKKFLLFLAHCLQHLSQLQGKSRVP